MTSPTNSKQEDSQEKSPRDGDVNDENRGLEVSSKELKRQGSPSNSDEPQQQGTRNEKDIEASNDPASQRPDIVASEDYSVFTVGQKRSIVLAGSFIAWFSPVR